MKLPRVSIGRMMIVVLLIALASVAMLRPTRLTASLAFSAAFLAFTLATLIAAFGRKKSRAFAAGFAIGGWLSLLVHFGAFPSLDSPSLDTRHGTPPILPTTMILDLLYPRIIAGANDPQPYLVSFVMPMPTPPAPGARTTTPPVPTPTTATLSVPATLNVPPAPPLPITNSFWTEPDRGFITNVPSRSISFHTIGFSIISLVFAVICGYMATWQHARQEWENPHTPN